MQRYSVSVVYENQTREKIYHALRVSIIYAVSQEEALGKMLGMVKDEFKDGWLLYLNTVMLIPEPENK